MAEYIYGKNTVRQYLKERKKINEIYFSQQFKDKELIDLASRYHLKIHWVHSGKLDELSSNGNHQGVVIAVDNFHYYELAEITANPQQPYPLIVMLDGVEDPHNLGAILRSADAAGVDGVIIGKHRSAELNATVAKVSTGAIESVKVHQATNLSQTLKQLKEQGYWVVGAEMDEHAQSYETLKYDMPIVLVIGSEGFGLSSIVQKQCDFKVYLPMYGKVNSLNASVACGILLYQINLQRHK